MQSPRSGDLADEANRIGLQQISWKVSEREMETSPASKGREGICIPPYLLPSPRYVEVRLLGWFLTSGRQLGQPSPSVSFFSLHLST